MSLLSYKKWLNAMVCRAHLAIKDEPALEKKEGQQRAIMRMWCAAHPQSHAAPPLPMPPHPHSGNM